MSLRLHRVLLSAAGALIVLAASPAGAGPAGGSVAGGSATIQGDGSRAVTINQSSPNAIINWQTFNIGKGESTSFNQPNSSSIALNRVIGGLGPSFIDGTLTANGRVFIVNGDGILLGAHSVISTAGFLATTNDIRNDDFMAGRYNFTIRGRPDASIVNLGKVTATTGGFAALVAPGVRNAGTITATLGTVSLAAGNAFTLDFYGDKLITLAVNDQIAGKVLDVATGKPLTSLVENAGRIRANGGRVEITAAAARKVVDSVINNTGVIEANSIGTHDGMIVLEAATAASKPAGAPTQTVRLSGRISAAGKGKGTTGGTVVATGENVELNGARIDASGEAGGGKVLIGGDTGGGHPSAAAAAIELAKLESFAIPTASTVSIDARTRIDASATGQGNGGKVVVWSDQQTSFAGNIAARGGQAGGNGGFVETSSHGRLIFTGTVDLGARKGSTGTLLLDPYNETICAFDCGKNTSFSGGVFSPTGSPSYLEASTLGEALRNANVMVTTGGAGSPGNEAGNITVDAAVAWGSNNSLTLSAYNSIFFTSNGSIANTGAGNLNLRADNSGRGIGTVSFSSPTPQINYAGSTGTVSIYYNPSVPGECEGNCGTTYQNPTDFSSSVSTNAAVPSQLSSYMLVNNAGDLALVGSNLGGTYALGKNIDATGFTGFASGATFTGLFDGNGGLGVNSTISNLTLTASQSQNAVGLFPFIGPAATARNLVLSNVNITAGNNIQNIGPLAGENDGTISNVTVASGSVNGGSFAGIGAGGLVGQNKGLISGATTTVTVSVGNASSATALNIAGGITATNLGAIMSSVANGPVSGGAFSWVGGVAGQNGLGGPGGGSGTISSSYAQATVSVVGLSSLAGGLVGNQAAGSSILDSQAFGSVSSNAGGQQPTDFAYVGGLVGKNFGAVAGSTTPSLTSTCTAGAAFSCATGVVTVGSLGWAGGVIGDNRGAVGNTLATGPVTGGANSVLGGLAGGSDVGASVLSSSATGAVTSNGAGSVVAGLIGANGGLVESSQSSGPVNGTSTSYLGGLAGINLGLVQSSFTTSTASVTGSGAQDAAGGFAGLNLGTIDSSSSAGNVMAGPNSIVGGFVGANVAFNNFPPGQVLGSFPVGTISSGSAGTGSASGGAGSIVGAQVGLNSPTTGLPTFPTAGTTCGNSFATFSARAPSRRARPTRQPALA
jgi:filamentous hemagglutinin family protein